MNQWNTGSTNTQSVNSPNIPQSVEDSHNKPQASESLLNLQAVENSSRTQSVTKSHPLNPQAVQHQNSPQSVEEGWHTQAIRDNPPSVEPQSVEQQTEAAHHKTGTYIGEGAWISSSEWQEETKKTEIKKEPYPRDTEEQYQARLQEDHDIALYEVVRRGGYPNRWGARIPLKHRWNLQLLENLL